MADLATTLGYWIGLYLVIVLTLGAASVALSGSVALCVFAWRYIIGYRKSDTHE